MPLRHIVFSVVILTAACGASQRLVGLRQKEDSAIRPAKPAVNVPIAEAEPISGSSIAPGGAGGRQS